MQNGPRVAALAHELRAVAFKVAVPETGKATYGDSGAGKELSRAMHYGNDSAERVLWVTVKPFQIATVIRT